MIWNLLKVFHVSFLHYKRLSIAVKWKDNEAPTTDEYLKKIWQITQMVMLTNYVRVDNNKKTNFL